MDEFTSIMLYYWGKRGEALDPLPPMPEQEPQRTAEAVRRALPALLRLQRYEARAAARRDRAVRNLALIEYLTHDTTYTLMGSCLAKRTQFPYLESSP